MIFIKTNISIGLIKCLVVLFSLRESRLLTDRGQCIHDKNTDLSSLDRVFCDFEDIIDRQLHFVENTRMFGS